MRKIGTCVYVHMYVYVERHTGRRSHAYGIMHKNIFLCKQIKKVYIYVYRAAIKYDYHSALAAVLLCSTLLIQSRLLASPWQDRPLQAAQKLLRSQEAHKRTPRYVWTMAPSTVVEFMYAVFFWGMADKRHYTVETMSVVLPGLEMMPTTWLVFEGGILLWLPGGHRI